MELYYKDLISKDASLEKLVDDLTLVVQGANELAQAAGVNLSPAHQEELADRLARLKAGCHRIKEQAISSAQAADKVLRANPYSALGLAFVLGLIAGALITRRR